VLAGDLVAAGYAVGVDGEQGTHAVPGAGSDLGGRGAGGQPQRQQFWNPTGHPVADLSQARVPPVLGGLLSEYEPAA